MPKLDELINGLRDAMQLLSHWEQADLRDCKSAIGFLITYGDTREKQFACEIERKLNAYPF